MSKRLAPRPGAARAKKEAARRLRIRIRDEELTFSPQITIQEKFAVRRATGMPWDAFTGLLETSFGEDTLVVFWWLAKRQNGEPNLPMLKVQQDWPDDLTSEDLDVDWVDDEPGGDDDPEGSGAG